jgi:hypothetical protein
MQVGGACCWRGLLLEGPAVAHRLVRLVACMGLLSPCIPLVLRLRSGLCSVVARLSSDSSIYCPPKHWVSVLLQAVGAMNHMAVCGACAEMKRGSLVPLTDTWQPDMVSWLGLESAPCGLAGGGLPCPARLAVSASGSFVPVCLKCA